jgi:2-octaprenyl-6-methoxyphenol hydroxylase
VTETDTTHAVEAPTEKARIVVVGGGLAGLLLGYVVAASCRDRLSVTLIERALPETPEASLDTRATAISRESKVLLEKWGLWQAVSVGAQPIEDIHVSRSARFGSATLRDPLEDLEPMGWVIENSVLQHALVSSAALEGVTLLEGAEVVDFYAMGDRPRLTLSTSDAIEADLVVIADGANSSLRSALGIGAVHHAPSQFAIAVNCETESAASGVAYERFTSEGPLALLPIPNASSSRARYNVIWCAHRERQSELLELSDGDFIDALQEEFGWRAGKITRVGRRTGWPLGRVTARELVRSRCVLLGNSAHTLHPVAGQGFNLSLRDVSRLAALISSEVEEPSPFDSVARLSVFAENSRYDHEQTIGATSLLAEMLDSPSLVIDSAASVGLSMLDLSTGAKRRVAQFGMGKR